MCLGEEEEDGLTTRAEVGSCPGTFSLLERTRRQKNLGAKFSSHNTHTRVTTCLCFASFALPEPCLVSALHEVAVAEANLSPLGRPVSDVEHKVIGWKKKSTF